MVCKYEAIDYVKRKVGTITIGEYNDIKCIQGKLSVGELMAVPVIDKLLNNLDEQLNIIDASPGTSCNVVSILHETDRCILVTEPTKFGLHDLKRAVTLVRKFNIPFGVIINRVKETDNLVKKYCQKENIKILGEINYDIIIAKLYSNGELLINDNRYKNKFIKLSNTIKRDLLCN